MSQSEKFYVDYFKKKEEQRYILIPTKQDLIIYYSLSKKWTLQSCDSKLTFMILD